MHLFKRYAIDTIRVVKSVSLFLKILVHMHLGKRDQFLQSLYNVRLKINSINQAKASKSTLQASFLRICPMLSKSRKHYLKCHFFSRDASYLKFQKCLIFHKFSEHTFTMIFSFRGRVKLTIVLIRKTSMKLFENLITA